MPNQGNPNLQNVCDIKHNQQDFYVLNNINIYLISEVNDYINTWQKVQKLSVGCILIETATKAQQVKKASISSGHRVYFFFDTCIRGLRV